MFLTKISVHRPIAVIMLVLLLVISGIISFFKIPVTLMPETELPSVSVAIPFPGAGAEKIETTVFKPIEEQLTSITNIRNISSFSTDGYGFISVECSSDADPELEALNIKGKIDQILSELRQTIKNLPYAKVTVNNPYILKLALCGPLNPEELRTIAKKQIVPQLKNVNGVAEVSIVGGKEREIQINLYKHRLDGLKLSFQAVAAIVAAQTATITGGDISGDYKKYSVRVKGELESIDQIKNIGVPVFSKSDTISVPLYTIAEIKDSYKETREVARFDGKNAIGISVVKKNKNGIIAVSDSVHLLINQINRILPSGTTIHTVLDQADSIRDSVKKISVNMLLGTGLIALVLFILLGSWRIAFIVALIIPVSISITASGIQFLKLTFNPVSFIAIPYAASVIFANVIIVVESILKNLNGKNATKESVVHCTSEVIKIIITMVLFNVAVFLPIIMAKDITGHAFKSLGWIIIISSVVSAFLSLTIIPLTVSKIMVSHKGSRPVRILSIISSVYMKMLRFAIRLKYGVVFLMIILLICTAYFIFPQTAMMLFPSEDSGIIKVSIKMVPGTTQHEGDRTIKIIEDKLMHISELKSTFSTSDSSKIYTGTDFIDITVLLNDKKTRRKTAKIIAKDIRLLLADIPDAEINVNVFNPTGTQGSGSDITIEITGEEINELSQIADSVLFRMRTMSDLTDIYCSSRNLKPELILVPDRFSINKYDANVNDIGLVVRDGLSGKNIGVYRGGGMEYPIRIQYAESDRNTLHGFENYSITTAKGNVPLKVLCNVTSGEGDAYINRKNGQRLVTITANTVNGISLLKKQKIKELVNNLKLPAGYKIHYTSTQDKVYDGLSAMLIALGIAVILCYMILAGATESIFLPFIMLCIVPCGFAGVLWALYFNGQSVSIISLVAVLIITGIIGCCAVIIIDKIRSLQKSGLSRNESFYEAFKSKFQTIVMIHLAVVLSISPMVVNGSAVEIQFAVAVIGGIIASAFMILFVIPALFLRSKNTKGNYSGINSKF